MRRWVPVAVLAVVIAAIAAWRVLTPRPPGGAALTERTWDTPMCGAPQLLPARPHPGGHPAFLDWKAPANTRIALADLPGEVAGEAGAEVSIVARYGAADLAGWEQSNEGGPHLVSPRLGRPAGASRIRVTLRPHGVTRLQVVPTPKDDWDYRERRLRALDFTLDTPTDPDAPVVLTGDIADTLSGNWGDDNRKDVGLSRLGFAWSGDVAPTFEEVVLLGPDALYDGVGGQRIADVGGELHPSWYVRPGGAVRLPLSVPADATLSFWDAGVGGPMTRRLTVVDGEARTEVFTATSDAGWARHALSLAPWAGRDVVLELTVDGAGVALLGGGRVIAGDPGPAPNVIVYLIDTLRADQLGAYGSPVRRVSPHLDRVAEQGAVFGLAVSSSPWTKPAIPTVMTGMWSTTHKVGAATYTDLLPPTVPVVQQRFGDAGWRTGSFSASPLGSTLSGLERGFDTAVAPHAWRGDLGRLGHVSAAQLTDAFLAWQSEEPQAPFFAYIHTLEVHAWRRSLYSRPPEGMVPYQFSIRDADLQFGELITALEARGLADDTLIVVLSDHGESFDDHGVKGHGSSLYQSQLHIPLLFWAGDAIPPVTLTDPVSIADVAPTLLDLFDLPPLPDATGKSLVPYLAGPVTAPVHDTVPAARLRYLWLAKDPPIYAVVGSDRHKLIRWADHEEAYDLGADACEARSLAHAPDGLDAALDAFLTSEGERAATFRAVHGTADAAVDVSDVEMLREMGYLE